MVLPVVAPSGQFVARPIRSALVPKEGPKSVAFILPYGSIGAGTYAADLTSMYLGGNVTTIQSVFIDNIAGSHAVQLDVPATGQSLLWPAGMAGYLPVLAPDTPVFNFTSDNSTTDIRCFLVNVPVPTPGFWSASGGSVVIPNPLAVTGDWLTDAELRAAPLLVSTTPADDEAIIGRVGGQMLRCTPTTQPSVTAGSAYASGNVVGSLLTFTACARLGVGSGLLQSLIMTTQSAQTGQFDVLLFRDNPSASTFTDKTALSVNTADLDKLFGFVTLTAPESLGTPSMYQAQQLAMPFQCASGTTLYAVIVTRATPTFSSTSGVNIRFNTLPN